jgi:hypothetical protein
MTKQKKILLAFAGQPIEQSGTVFEIQDGYECWDLKKISFDDFVDLLKEKIPPLNDNVLRNYKLIEDSRDMYGISEEQYNKCSWALLIPENLDDEISSGYAEIIFLLNLYSPAFLYPLFCASDFGIERHSHGKAILTFSHYQNQSGILKTKNFVSFFRTLLPQSKYGTWQLDRIQKWNKEDWRLFVASLLFDGLKKYDNSKNSFGWQRESADMAAILESLFTAGDNQNEEIGYRLRKRIAVLLSWKFPTIEDEIKELYNQRSSFVHGSFFARIAKDSRHSYNNLPIADFELLYRQRNYVRLALVAYLYLAQQIIQKPAEYKQNKIVIKVLEKAIIDVELREKLLKEVRELFSLMPE